MIRSTKPIPACRTSGSFESYTLTKKYSVNQGLTSIPYEKMTRIIDPGEDDTEVVVNIGFDFWFDGCSYRSMVVSANGFIILGGTQFSDAMDENWRPASIYTSITYPVTLLCPWFVDSATLNSNVPTYGPLGGVYQCTDRSSYGSRTIIRWVNMNYTAGGTVLSDGMIIYECVLYEASGKVEFRFSPKIRNPGIVTSSAEPVGRGGSIGVWTTGSNRWRDFTRSNIRFGGATVDPSYTYVEGTEIPASWSYDRRVYSVVSGTKTLPGNWPGGLTFGSIWTFEPPVGSTRRSIRQDLRTLDNGSLIDGGSSYFDDQTILLYHTSSSTQTINFPSTLPALHADQSKLSDKFKGCQTSLVSDSSTEVGASHAASEYFISIANAECNIESSEQHPFDETKGIEQGLLYKTSSFYMTGSSVEEYGIGFSQNIGSKHVIRLSYPILSQTLLRPTTASIYYYDPARMTVLEYGTSPRIDPGSLNMPGAMVDSIGFTPLGTFCSQIENSEFDKVFIRSNVGDGKRHPTCAAGFGQKFTSTTKNDSLAGRNEGVVTLSSSFRQNITGTISLKNIINSPFLLEKAIFRIPIAAGPGWTQDRTRTKRTLGFDDFDHGMTDGADSICSGSLFNVSEDWPLDVGGPCVTVGLMNQMGPVIRDLILTGTIIPTGDDKSDMVIQLARRQGVVDYDSDTKYLEHYSVTQEGFRSFGRSPSAVVIPDSSGQFTGSVVIQATCVTSNGLVVQPRHVLGPRSTSDLTGSTYVFASASSGVSPWPMVTSFGSTSSYWNGSLYRMTCLVEDSTGTPLAVPTTYMGRYGNSTIKVGSSGSSLNGDWILSVNPCGRSQAGFLHTGRSIRDIVGLTDTDLEIENPLYSFKSEIETFMSGLHDVTASVKLNDGNHATFELVPDVVHVVESSQYAPYILTPDDNLIFFLSKCRPVKSASLSLTKGELSVTSSIRPGGTWTAADPKYALLTGSHDIRVMSGTLDIILFGSYVQENVEKENVNFKKSVYQDVVSDVIANDPVLDQFESEYHNVYDGTYTDEYITGSMFTWVVNENSKTKTFVQRERGRAGQSSDNGSSLLNARDLASQLTHLRERHTTQLFVQSHDNVERYWDTLLPPVSDIWNADDTNVYYTTNLRMEMVAATASNFVCAAFYAGPQVLPSSDAIYYTAPHNHYEQTASIKLTNLKWPHAFPYEPRYSSITRSPDIASKFTTTKAVTVWGGSNFSPPISEGVFTQVDKTEVVSQGIYALNVLPASTGSWDQWGEIYCGLNFFDPQLGSGIMGGDIGKAFYDKREFTKALFGFATPDPDRVQKNSMWQQGDAVNPDFMSKFFRKTPIRMKSKLERAFEVRSILAGYRTYYYSAGLMIDGWKYGILNGFRQTSKMIFRRDSYGQFRDMLEQRLDGKFYYEEIEEKCGTYDPILTPNTTLSTYYDESPFSRKKIPGGTIGTSPVIVKFIGSDGSLTTPEKTDSSNLSLEATSSLPYFDGQVRNRPSEWTMGNNSSFGQLATTLQKSANLNKKIISWTTDGRGNTTLG